MPTNNRSIEANFTPIKPRYPPKRASNPWRRLLQPAHPPRVSQRSRPKKPPSAQPNQNKAGVTIILRDPNIRVMMRKAPGPSSSQIPPSTKPGRHAKAGGANPKPAPQSHQKSALQNRPGPLPQLNPGYASQSKPTPKSYVQSANNAHPNTPKSATASKPHRGPAPRPQHPPSSVVAPVPLYNLRPYPANPQNNPASAPPMHSPTNPSNTAIKQAAPSFPAAPLHNAPKSMPPYNAANPAAPSYPAVPSNNAQQSAPQFAPKSTHPSRNTFKSVPAGYSASQPAGSAYNAPRHAAPSNTAPKPSSRSYNSPKPATQAYNAPQPVVQPYQAPHAQRYQASAAQHVVPTFPGPAGISYPGVLPKFVVPPYIAPPPNPAAPLQPASAPNPVASSYSPSASAPAKQSGHKPNASWQRISIKLSTNGRNGPNTPIRKPETKPPIEPVAFETYAAYDKRGNVVSRKVRVGQNDRPPLKEIHRRYQLASRFATAY